MRPSRALIVIIPGLMIGMAMPAAAKNAPLSSLLWKNRVLVVTAPNRQDESLIAQRRIFEQNASGMAERQIILIEAIGDDERARDIRKQLAVGNKTFKVLLIGKDGHTALSSEKPLMAGDLFSRVDAMPMRRDEMRRNK